MEMMNNILKWIDGQQQIMIDLLCKWSNINSGSENLNGLAVMLKAIEAEFSSLDASIQRVSLPPRQDVDGDGKVISIPTGQALHISKRREAPFKIFLGGHMDTVYGIDHPFQSCQQIAPNILRGPGVTDMKGGLIVMLKSLQALEQHPSAHAIGWEVLINPDEEVGSSGSEAILRECAHRNNIGLIFEPSFPDGFLTSSRKGSANYAIVMRGKAAHAGRHFDEGRNAITALAKLILEIEALNSPKEGTTVNIGQIKGGGPVNIVPDFAICHFNVRAITLANFEEVQHQLEQLANAYHQDGITLQLIPQQSRVPKNINSESQKLFDLLAKCGNEEGLKLEYRPSGGVCDGNIIAEEGLPVIDTLGVIGGNIHTPEEYVLLDSLTSRTRLVTRFLVESLSRSL